MDCHDGSLAKLVADLQTEIELRPINLYNSLYDSGSRSFLWHATLVGYTFSEYRHKEHQCVVQGQGKSVKSALKDLARVVSYRDICLTGTGWGIISHSIGLVVCDEESFLDCDENR